MELSQPRPYGAAEGRKPTHDFLSLYSPQQDPRPTSQGFNLKTHDFLQPLERVGKGCAKEEVLSEKAAGEKLSPAPVEHVLPGGIGTYSISQIPYFSPIRAPKPEGSSNSRNDENSNGSSYTGSGFTLWEESATKKGKTGKENMRDKSAVIEATTSRGGQWAGSSAERPTQSSSNNHHGSFNSLSSSLPSRQRSKSLMEMIKSAKGSNGLEDEFEEDEHFLLKKEISSATTNELRVRVDGKGSDQKANTPRSKHSATEQRRRSKINDRFQMLRDLIPHGDQKRDKASFLLEVIEYIQFLQDKVQKYEGPYQGWNSEQTKLMPWKNNRNVGDDFDRSQAMNGSSAPGVLAFPKKVEDEPLLVSQNTVVPEALAAQKGTSFAVSSVEARLLSQGALSRLLSDVENATTSHRQARSCTTIDGGVAADKLKEEEITIEGGSISISTAYSQGLLRTLTQALQSSGVDLSQASISVQIELGKRANTNSLTKDDGILPSNQNAEHCRATNADDPSEQAQKKLKTSKN